MNVVDLVSIAETQQCLLVIQTPVEIRATHIRIERLRSQWLKSLQTGTPRPRRQ